MGEKIGFLSVAIFLLLLSGCASMEKSKERRNSDATVRACVKYEKIANNAHAYGSVNFYKTYAAANNLKGAEAQLFLIKEGMKGRSLGDFAVNYKAAERSYDESFSEAEKSRGTRILIFGYL